MAQATTAVTVDFTGAFIRRALQARLQGHGAIDVRRSTVGGVTIVHRYLSTWNGRPVELPVAQLRYRRGQVQLYWRHTTGRWVAYEGVEAAPFIGGLAACLEEITHDRWGCFWG